MNKYHNLNMEYKRGKEGPVYNNENTLIKAQIFF